MTRPTVIVAGLGRCGSSLTMQMLAAGGVSCVGRYPAFEVESHAGQRMLLSRIERYAGMAMKILDPHFMPIPRTADLAVIWLDRDIGEQTMSQVKMASIGRDIAPVTRGQRREWARSLRKDTSSGLRRFAGLPLKRIRFEDLIDEPAQTANVIASFLSPWFAVDAGAMAAQVRPRPVTCAPDMAMELSLIAARDHAAPQFCDHCGYHAKEARATGSKTCAPPFTVQPHAWTGKHPADKHRAAQGHA